jgi:hypothetical protein
MRSVAKATHRKACAGGRRSVTQPACARSYADPCECAQARGGRRFRLQTTHARARSIARVRASKTNAWRGSMEPGRALPAREKDPAGDRVRTFSAQRRSFLSTCAPEGRLSHSRLSKRSLRAGPRPSRARRPHASARRARTAAVCNPRRARSSCKPAAPPSARQWQPPATPTTAATAAAEPNPGRAAPARRAAGAGACRTFQKEHKGAGRTRERGARGGEEEESCRGCQTSGAFGKFSPLL